MLFLQINKTMENLFDRRVTLFDRRVTIKKSSFLFQTQQPYVCS